jgi:nucleoside-diphosphate-sugar epimerase
MKVLILGATGESPCPHFINRSDDFVGFIGLPAAQAFVRGGHIVYGQSRSEKSKGELIKEEIIPIVLNPATGEGVKAFVDLVKNVDVGVLHSYSEGRN